MGVLQRINNTTAHTTTPAQTVLPEPTHLETIEAATPPVGLQASVTTLATLEPETRRNTLNHTNQQNQLIDYIVHGNPGIAGAAVDVIANAAGLLTPVVKKWDGNGWNTADAPDLLEILQMFRSPTEDTKKLVQRVYRYFEAPGSLAIVLIPKTVSNGARYLAVSSNQVAPDLDDRSMIVRTRPHAREGQQGWWRVPVENIWYAWRPDPVWESTPWSPHLRGLEALDGFRATMRVIGRNRNSQLAMNGILWAQAMPGASAAKPEWMRQLTEWAKVGSNANKQREDITDYAPFSMQTAGKVEKIDVGRENFDELIRLADWHLEQYARDIDFPTSWLLKGPGTEKYANAFYQDDWFADYSMRGRSDLVWDTITKAVLRPWMRVAQANGVMLEHGDPDLWCLDVDDSGLRGSADTAPMKLELVKLGFYDGRALALDVAEGDASKVVDPCDPTCGEEGGAGSPRDQAELVQKLYLGTPSKQVITEGEARKILESAGAELDEQLPEPSVQAVVSSDLITL